MGFVLGWLIGFSSALMVLSLCRKRPTPDPWRVTLMPTLTLPADVKVSVGAKAVVKDSEGNIVNASPEVTNLEASIENASANFGELNGLEFNPGASGETGEIHVTADVDGNPHEGSVSIELVAGAPAVTELSVELTPVPQD